VAKLKSPHTQSQQNEIVERPDLEPGEDARDSGTDEEADIYENMAGAETGGTRSPRRVSERPLNRSTAGSVAHEGAVTTRSPKGRKQGITSHASEEESSRQEKVVKKRADAQAGVNQTRRKRA
jgi:hypothetical protein